ncbi:Periaxin [Balamuthia mandrillaris]
MKAVLFVFGLLLTSAFAMGSSNSDSDSNGGDIMNGYGGGGNVYAPDVTYNKYSEDIKMPIVYFEDIKMGDIHVPDLYPGDIKVPDIKFPDHKMKNIKLPDIKTPMIEIPGTVSFRWLSLPPPRCDC